MKYPNLGEALKAERFRQGRSQSEVAAAAGIKNSRLCEFENDRYDPSLKSFLAWCGALNVSIDAVLAQVER